MSVLAQLGLPELGALNRWRRRRIAYLTAFGGEPGAIVLRDLYDFAGVDRTSHVPGDALETAFNEGKRRVALRIRSILGEDEPEFLRRAQSLVADEP